MSKYRHLSTILTVIVIVISTTLLLGRLFDARFAGGDGYQPHGVATVDDASFQRGEIIASGDDFSVVTIGDTTIYLADRTELRLDDIQGDITVTLIQGRMIVDGQLYIKIRETVLQTEGMMSVVHFSWLDHVTVSTIDGSAQLYLAGEEAQIPSQHFSYTTLAPYTLSETTFEPRQGATDFYEWFIERRS